MCTQIDTALICDIAKDCLDSSINDSTVMFERLVLENDLDNCSSAMLRGIAEWGFVRGILKLRLDPKQCKGYAMFIYAMICIQEDGSIDFENGDILFSDLKDREDVNIKLYEVDQDLPFKERELVFSSYGNDCSFFQEKIGQINYQDLENAIIKCDRQRLKQFKKDCRKIIKTAKILN